MNTPKIAEFRKKLSTAHRRKISNSLKQRGKGEREPGEKFDKNVLRVTHLTNSTNNATKAYYNVARGTKDFQLVRKYNQAMRPASRTRRLGNALDSGIRRSEAGSRITSRLSLIPARLPRNSVRTMIRNPSGYTLSYASRLSGLF